MDYSFLRLSPSFDEAKQLMLDPKQSKQRYYDCISLLPNERYLQITSSKTDIVFNNSYKVSIIDCNENELKDITDKVTIFEFFDNKGVRQISFEIEGIGESWYMLSVFLKFESTIGTDVFYSNAFTVSDEYEYETIRLIYKSYGIFQGTDYTNAPYYQSIRIKAEFQNTEDATDNATYTQTNGNVISMNPTVVFPENYFIDYINNFTFRALAVALKSDVVYLEDYRVTDRPTLKNGERLGNSNLTSCDFIVHRNLDDKANDIPQLSPQLSILNKEPKGTYSTAMLEAQKIIIEFNKNIVINVGQLKIYGEGGYLKATLTQSDFTVSGNIVTSNEFLSEYVTEYGKYYITFTEGLFKTIDEQTLSITNVSDFTFNYSVGDWLGSDWSEDDFLIYEL